MSERGSSEIEPAPFSEGDIAGLVNQLLGNDSWSGGDSYEIKIADSEAQIAYIFQLRKGDGWMTIQKRSSHNPGLVESFYLEFDGNDWKYNDPTLAKYGESSLNKLQDAYGILFKAVS